MRKLIPQVRFPEFTGEWSLSNLGSFCEFNQGVQVDVELQVNEYKYGYSKFIRIENYTQKSNDFRYIPSEMANKKKINETEIAIVRYGATAGYIGRGLKGVLANNLFKVIPNKEILDNSYLFEYLKSFKSFCFFQTEMSGGAMPALSFSIVGRLKISYPSLPEQIKIASFLTAVDEKLTALNQKKSLLEQYKKGVMQQIFGRDAIHGVSVIRFKDDNGNDFPDWEEKKLGEVCKINPKSNSLPSSFIYIDLESVVTGQLLKETTIQLSEAPSRAQRLLSNEDILFQMVRPYQKNNLFFNRNGEYVASTGYAQLRAKESPMFLYQLIHTTDFVFKVIDRCTGTSYPAINSTDLANILVEVPSLPEQIKIANFLSAIDVKINHCQEQIDQTTIWKKGLLQQMFV